MSNSVDRGIPAEPILQLYRGAVPGRTAEAKRAELTRVVIEARRLGVTHIAFHGFPRELAGAWNGLAAMADSVGVKALAAWGLDAETDNGRPFSGAAKGEFVGRVLASASCVAGLLDMEGRWDDADAGKPGDATDRDDALAMCEALRKLAPNALVGDQPWYAILAHGDVRRTPSGQDVFRGFPVDEVARVGVNWRRFRQLYPNHAQTKAQLGTRRYPALRSRMNREWGALAAPFAKAGLPLDLGCTFQAYGWSDCPWHLVDALLTECVTLQRPCILWCDYEPDRTTKAALAFLKFLRERGFAEPGTDSREVVRAFQRSTGCLAVDGWAGRETLSHAGILL
jgi:hypothetical protein